MKHRIGNYISFLSIIIAITPLHAIQRSHVKKEVAAAQVIAQEVSKDVSLLDQIIEQSGIIVETTNSKEWVTARKKLARLMNHKDLDPNIKNAIQKDVQIIQNNNISHNKRVEAYHRLLAIADKIEAEANAIAIAAQAAKAVETASPEELEKIVAEAQKNMQEADQEVKEEQSTVRRLYSRAKRLVTAPVDYVFGEESSKAKTAFYAAVGAAAAAAMAYGIYKYKFAPSGDLPSIPTETTTNINDLKKEWYELSEHSKNLSKEEQYYTSLVDEWRRTNPDKHRISGELLQRGNYEDFYKIIQTGNNALTQDEIRGWYMINAERDDIINKLVNLATQIGETDQNWFAESVTKARQAQEREDKKSNWLEDLQFKNEEENLPKRFNELTNEFPPISSFSENIKPKAIEYRLEEWEKLINDLNRHNQVMPSPEKNNMLDSAKEALRALKAEQKSFLQHQQRKAEYDEDIKNITETLGLY